MFNNPKNSYLPVNTIKYSIIGSQDYEEYYEKAKFFEQEKFSF